MKRTFLSREPVLNTDAFIGRQAEIKWVTDKLGRQMPQNCNLAGEPRIGKSSLLHYIYRQKVGLPPGSRGLYVWVRLVELPEHHSLSFWQFMWQRLQMTQKEEVDLEVAQDARDVFYALDSVIEQLLTAGGYGRLIFLIDDFDLLLPRGDRPGIGVRDLDWLRSLATRYGDALAFVITTTGSLVSVTSQLTAETAVSPFANLFHDLPLGLLAKPEAQRLCRQAAVAESLPPLQDADIDFLLQEAGQHPDLLKVACSYFLAARQPGAQASLQLYEDVKSDVRLDRHVDWLCQQLWARRTAAEQQVLRALVDGAPVPDRIILNRLRRHLGLVVEEAGQPVLFAGTFRYWICRHATPGPQEKESSASSHLPSLTYLPEQRMARLDGREVRLTPLESRLLNYLVQNANQICTVEALLQNVWGPGKTRSVVEKGINRLRAKIEKDPKRPRYVLSARGEGYLLRME